MARCDLPAVAAAGCERGHCFSWLRRPPGRAHDCRREHGVPAQHGRVHAVQLLSVAGAQASAYLVQEHAVSHACSERSPRRAHGFRRHTAGIHGDQSVRLHGRSTIPRHPAPSRRHGRPHGRRACLPRHARLDDRHRSAAPGQRTHMSYRSHADLGGQSGHGRVIPEPEGELLFHAAWEPKALALTLAMGATGAWNIDMSRSARETLPNYASLSYYALWIEGLQKLLAERRLLQETEMLAGRMLDSPGVVPRVLKAADVPPALAFGAPTQRTPTTPARFAIDDRVRTRHGDVPHHTRLPHYASGRIGRIDRIHGVHVF